MPERERERLGCVVGVLPWDVWAAAKVVVGLMGLFLALVPCLEWRAFLVVEASEEEHLLRAIRRHVLVRRERRFGERQGMELNVNMFSVVRVVRGESGLSHEDARAALWMNGIVCDQSQ